MGNEVCLKEKKSARTHLSQIIDSPIHQVGVGMGEMGLVGGLEIFLSKNVQRSLGDHLLSPPESR